MFLTANPKYLRPSANNFVSKTVDTLINDAFGALEQTQDVWGVNNANFPPYNIISKKDGKEYTIEIAIAGFSKGEVQIESENGVLTISGNKEPRADKISYITHGIAYRNFVRSFTLAHDIIVDAAMFEDGLLKINLIKIQPEPKKRNYITIK